MLAHLGARARIRTRTSRAHSFVAHAPHLSAGLLSGGITRVVNLTAVAERAMNSVGLRRRRALNPDCLSLVRLSQCVNELIADELDNFKYGHMSLNRVKMTGGYDTETNKVAFGVSLDVNVDLVGIIGDVINKVSHNAAFCYSAHLYNQRNFQFVRSRGYV